MKQQPKYEIHGLSDFTVVSDDPPEIGAEGNIELTLDSFELAGGGIAHRVRLQLPWKTAYELASELLDASVAQAKESNLEA